jgi:hypothetical protein
VVSNVSVDLLDLHLPQLPKYPMQQITLWVTCEATPQKTFRGRASPSDIPTFKASRFQSFPAVEKIRRYELAGSREQHGAGNNVYTELYRYRPFSIPKHTEAKVIKQLSTRRIRHSGRNDLGRICTRHREGGAMQRLRFVDFKRGRKDLALNILKASWIIGVTWSD